MPLLFLCKSFDLISDAARLKLAKNTMTVEQILIFIFSVCFFFLQNLCQDCFYLLRHQSFISKFMIDHLSHLTSHLSCLTAGCVGVDGESRDLRLSSPGLTRPRDVTPPGSWPPHGLGSPLHHGRERERDRRVEMWGPSFSSVAVRREPAGSQLLQWQGDQLWGRKTSSARIVGIYMHFNLD